MNGDIKSLLIKIKFGGLQKAGLLFLFLDEWIKNYIYIFWKNNIQIICNIQNFSLYFLI